MAAAAAADQVLHHALLCSACGSHAVKVHMYTLRQVTMCTYNKEVLLTFGVVATSCGEFKEMPACCRVQRWLSAS
jgi:hypothetical protein